MVQPAALIEAADFVDSLTRSGHELTNRGGRLYIAPVPAAAVMQSLGNLHEEIKCVLRSRTAARHAIERARKAARRTEREAAHG